jgi:hypothetical protein
MSDHNETGNVYGHYQDPRAAEGYTANIGPATSPLSTVAFVDATGNPYETSQTKYNELLKTVGDMERNHPELKGKVNLANVDHNSMASINAAIENAKALVREQEAKELTKSMGKGIAAVIGLELAKESATGMGGKGLLGSMLVTETEQQKSKEEANRPIDLKKEGLLAMLTPEQRDAPARNGIEGGEHVSRGALFTPETAAMQSPNLVAARQREQQQDTGRSLSFAG